MVERGVGVDETVGVRLKLEFLKYHLFKTLFMFHSKTKFNFHMIFNQLQNYIAKKQEYLQHTFYF